MIYENLIRHGNKLVGLPFGEAFSLGSFEKIEAVTSSTSSAGHDDVTRTRIYSTLIPAFTYGVEPPALPSLCRPSVPGSC